jgi:hypothetical protein
MDSSRQALENADLEKLNDKDKQELRQFLANESQRSQIQSRQSPYSPAAFARLLTILPRQKPMR